MAVAVDVMVTKLVVPPDFLAEAEVVVILVVVVPVRAILDSGLATAEPQHRFQI